MTDFYTPHYRELYLESKNYALSSEKTGRKALTLLFKYGSQNLASFQEDARKDGKNPRTVTCYSSYVKGFLKFIKTATLQPQKIEQKEKPILEETPKKEPTKPPKKKEKRRLFFRLVEAIENFGSNNHHRISTIKDEEEFQRIFEGYLLATFPDETITPELYYKGYDERNSRIDFAVGKAPQIPIELKFARGNIRDYLHTGSGQVKEFLKSSRSKKGILAILSKDRGRVYERAREFSGIQNGDVHIVII